MNKKSFYCWYLGFAETYGLQGQTRIQELIKNFLANQIKQKDMIAPSKVTVRLSESNMTLIDSHSASPMRRTSRKSKNDIAAPKTYTISYDKIGYVGRVATNSDLLTCIVRSDHIIEMTPNNSRKSMFYLHVFRCDSDESAKKMELYLNYFRKLFFKKVEKLQLKQQKDKLASSYQSKNSKNYLTSTQNEHLVNSNLKESFLRRQINRITHTQTKRPVDISSAGTSMSSHNDLSFISPVNSNSSLNYLHPSQHQYYQPNRSRTASPIQNINNEIIQKIKKGEPLLFPPKDYTNTLAKHGNLPDASKRRSRNPLVVGKEGLVMRDLNELNLELNDSFISNESDSNKDLDNTLDEQQVLNLLDEAVDSEYQYDSETKYVNKSQEDIRTPLQIIDEDQAFYSNSNTNYISKRNMDFVKEAARRNNKSAIKAIKPASVETPFRKKLFSFSNEKSDSNPSENNTISAASVGVRTNVLTKLGNFKPKIIENNKSILEEQQQGKFLPKNISSFQNNLTNIYSPYLYDSNRSSGLRRIREETNHLYATKNYPSSEFILKPSEFKAFNNNENQHNVYKNYVNIQDSSRYINQNLNNSSNLLGTLINVIPASNLSKKINNNFKNYQSNNSQNPINNVYELNRRYDNNEENKYYLNDIYY